MRIRWIIPLYDFPPNIPQICQPDRSRHTLEQISLLAGSDDDLVAAYVTKTLGHIEHRQPRERNYSAYAGRIAGFVRFLPMPPDRRMEDYFEQDWFYDETRWHIGWPVQAVRRPPPQECPSLTQISQIADVEIPSLQAPFELVGNLARLSTILMQHVPNQLSVTSYPAAWR